MLSDNEAIKAFENCLQNVADPKKNLIIEGFPKTVAQALYLKNNNIFPDTLIIANLDRSKALEQLQADSGLTEEQAELALMQHDVLFSKVAHFYRNCSQQVDLNLRSCSQDSQEKILERLSTLCSYPVKDYQPKRAMSLLLMGQPGSGRTSVARLLA